MHFATLINSTSVQKFCLFFFVKEETKKFAEVFNPARQQQASFFLSSICWTLWELSSRSRVGMGWGRDARNGVKCSEMRFQSLHGEEDIGLAWERNIVKDAQRWTVLLLFKWDSIQLWEWKSSNCCESSLSCIILLSVKIAKYGSSKSFRTPQIRKLFLKYYTLR